MPAFTYVASVIVANVIGIAGAAILGSAGVAFVTSVIALGLATVTSRLINGSGGGGGGTAQDPGVRIQFPPATNNKIPIIYGSANTKGTVTDARLGNENKTMTYVLVISEKTQTGTFTVGDIYWNDQKLVFDTDAGESHIVRSSIDQNGFGTSNTNFDGLIRFRIYSGSTAATDQIFPPQATGNTVNARTTLGESDTNYLLSGLVFAVIQVDYSSEKGTTGLGQITFQINNSLKNPGDVWYDYCSSARYGAGFPIANINTVTSIGSTSTSLKSISNTIPANQFEANGTTPSTQVRYEMNGVLSTGDTVKNNLDKICMSCAAWTTYDFQTGQWTVIPNRAATAGELANAFIFDDNNIVGDISINATSLEDLFNNLEVEFASRKLRDQNDYFKAEIAAVERNDLEPDNILNQRLEMANNALHAGRIGLIELKQSRIDLIISFTADWSALSVKAGDVIKVTNDIFDLSEKLFRVTKTREVERDDSVITVEITALEYNADIYIDETLLDSAENSGSGIGNIASSLPAPITPTVAGYPTASTPFFVVSTEIAAGSLPVDSVEFLISSNSTGPFTSLGVTVGPFVSGTAVNSANIAGRPSGTYYFRAKTFLGSRASSESSSSAAFTWALTPATPEIPFWQPIPNPLSGFPPSEDLFPNASTPYFYIHTIIPAGSITVSSVTFQYSTSSSTGFTSLVTMNGPFTATTDVRTSAITGVPVGTYYFRAFSTNNGNNSSITASSIGLEWDPNPTIDGGTIP